MCAALEEIGTSGVVPYPQPWLWMTRLIFVTEPLSCIFRCAHLPTCCIISPTKPPKAFLCWESSSPLLPPPRIPRDACVGMAVVNNTEAGRRRTGCSAMQGCYDMTPWLELALMTANMCLPRIRFSKPKARYRCVGAVKPFVFLCLGFG